MRSLVLTEPYTDRTILDRLYGNSTQHNYKIIQVGGDHAADATFPIPVIGRQDSSIPGLKQSLEEILFILKTEDFIPDVIEFFDDFRLAHLFLQHLLLNIGFDSHTPVIFHITKELPALLSDSVQTIRDHFQRSQFRFVCHSVEQVCCYIPQRKEQEIQKISGLTGLSSGKIRFPDSASGINYEALRTAGKKEKYPFPSAHEFSPLTKEEPLISVVVPHYNMGAYIEETIDHVLHSTYPNLEIILVDDGSTDPASLRIVDRIQNKDGRIIVLHQENNGVAEARNAGIRVSRGEIIALLDADDLVEPVYYEKAVRLFRQYKNVGFVGCWTRLFDERGMVDHWITHSPEAPLYYLMNTLNTQSILVRKEALVSHGLHDKDLNMVLDDWESVISMLAADIRGVVIPEFLFQYRIRRDSVYRSHQSRWISSYEKIIQKHFSGFHPHAREMLLLLVVNGPNIFYKDPESVTDYYKMMNNVPNFRIRNGLLTRWVNRYYNFVELNPVGVRLRNAFSTKSKASRISTTKADPV